MILKEIQNRRSVRSFTKEIPNDEQIKEIIKAAQFAPTAMNNRSWEFIVIKDQSTKEKLYELTAEQEAVKDAPVIIVPIIDTSKALLSTQDLSLATENMFLQITHMGLGAFWKNVSQQEIEPIKEYLNIPQSFTLVNIIPLGYPALETKPYSDSDFDENKIHWEKC
jgi:nitroreductase